MKIPLTIKRNLKKTTQKCYEKLTILTINVGKSQ